MNRFFRILVLCLAATCLPAEAQNRYAWKEATTVSARLVNKPQKTGGIEVYTRPSTLIVKTPEQIDVVVMSILGQTISKATISAGTYELQIPTSGIYIVRVSDFTLRVAI